MPFRVCSRRALSCMAAFVLASFLSSCTSDLLDPITQHWQLQTIKDAALPGTIPNSSPVIVVNSGTMVTKSDGTYTLSLTGTSDGAPGMVGSDQGHWSVTSGTFFFRSSNGIPDYIGALNTGAIRVAVAGQIVHSTNESIDMVFAQSQ
jgi:hypothetical protein